MKTLSFYPHSPGDLQAAFATAAPSLLRDGETFEPRGLGHAPATLNAMINLDIADEGPRLARS